MKGPVSVSLTAADGGSGLGATRYTLDGSDPDTSSPEYTAPFTLTDTTTVKFRTWDSGGAAENTKSQTIKVDAAGPTAQITSPADGSNVVGDVNVTADASDAGAGISDVELLLDGDSVAVSSAKPSPYTFTLAAGTIPLGTHKLKLVATDAVGNRTSSALITFNLTNGLPTTTIACDGGACPAGFAKGPVDVSLSAADGGSGLGATRYTLDGSDPDTSSPEYTAPFTLTDTTTVKFRTWDSNGNAEQVRSQEIKLDAVAPTAAITTPADGSDQVGAIDVKVDASDADSGIADVQLFVDGDYTDTSTSTASPYGFTLAAGSLSFGTHKLKAIATDKMGNTSSSLVTITLKDGLPTTTIACDGGTCPTGFVKDPVSVTLASIDGGSGVDATRYTLDGTDPDASSTMYTGPFTVSATTTVKFRSWSSAGDAEPVRTQTIKLDSAAPTAQISSPAEGDQVDGDVTIKVDAADADSGIGDVALFIDGDYVASSTSSASPYEFIWHTGDYVPGAHKLKAIVADKLDNRTNTAVVNVTIKAPAPPPGPPTTTISCDGLGCPTGFVKNPMSVTLGAIDGGSGVGPTRYTLDGSDPSETSTQYVGPFTVSDTTTVRFRSWSLDGAYVEAIQSQTIKFDSTPPTVQILSPSEGDTITGDLVVQADVADADSGVSNVDLYVDGDYAGYSNSLTSPYGITLPAGTLAPGTHTIKVEGTDKLGNALRTDAITITVSS